jgi:hypothetical protein
MKICPVGAELLHVGGWTDRHRQDEANSQFLQLCERALKKSRNKTAVQLQCLAAV